MITGKRLDAQSSSFRRAKIVVINGFTVIVYNFRLRILEVVPKPDRKSCV